MLYQKKDFISIGGKEWDLDTLTFGNLRWYYATGKAHAEGSGVNRKTIYQNGVATPIGNIEQSQWADLVRKLIERAGEWELYEHLVEWVKANCAWLSGDANARIYALNLHTDRIFDNPEWVGFIPFNEKYRPDVLCGRRDKLKEGADCCTSK